MGWGGRWNFRLDIQCHSDGRTYKAAEVRNDFVRNPARMAADARWIEFDTTVDLLGPVFGCGFDVSTQGLCGCAPSSGPLAVLAVQGMAAAIDHPDDNWWRRRDERLRKL